MPRGVFIRSEEHIEKLRKAMSGKSNWMRGRTGKDHPMHGKSRPQSFIDKISGPNNKAWKDKPGRVALHEYIRKRLPKPKLCPLCLLKPPKQLSNKTGIYNRDLKNWWWLCVKCHVYYDGTHKNLRCFKMIYSPDHKCIVCGSTKTPLNKYGTKMWRRGMCKKCYEKKTVRFVAETETRF